jgi:hypothetical protein
MDMYSGDPMGGGGMSGTSTSSASRSSPTLKIVLVCVACLIVLGVVYFAFIRSSTKPTSRPRATQQQQVIAPLPPATQATQATNDTMISEDAIAVEAPDIKVGTFAFESMTMPGYVPTLDGTIQKKTPGMPPFKFVACGDSGYAIRWNSVYLTLDADKNAYWHEEKLEPDSCFEVIPGQCGTTKHVMLRSSANNNFLRHDPTTKKLVCIDAPTGRTASTFCWKLEPDAVVTKQPCGCQYSYELGRVVCTPCDGVKEMPDSAGGSCSTVTSGYQATCCLRKGAAAQNDAYCNTVAWPEVVGRTLQEAMLYIRTRRPDLTLVPCSAPCTANAYPTQSPNTVVIPYDPRSGLVVAAARRLI